jgi:hypothetical protein
VQESLLLYTADLNVTSQQRWDAWGRFTEPVFAKVYGHQIPHCLLQSRHALMYSWMYQYEALRNAGVLGHLQKLEPQVPLITVAGNHEIGAHTWSTLFLLAGTAALWCSCLSSSVLANYHLPRKLDGTSACM